MFNRNVFLAVSMLSVFSVAAMQDERTPAERAAAIAAIQHFQRATGTPVTIAPYETEEEYEYSYEEQDDEQEQPSCLEALWRILFE